MNSMPKISHRQARSSETALFSAVKRSLLQALYRQHRAALVDFAAERLSDLDAAEDVVQDVFLSILEGQEEFPAVDVENRLRRIVSYHCKHRLADEGGPAEALRRARERAEEAAWRSRRVALKCRGATCEDGEDDL